MNQQNIGQPKIDHETLNGLNVQLCKPSVKMCAYASHWTTR